MNRLIYIVLLLTFPCLIPSSLATWLSPDPLLDKYPHISPYAYCNWNPVKYTDPDGKRIIIEGYCLIEKIAYRLGCRIGYIKQVQNDLNQLKRDNREVYAMIVRLENSPNIHTIRYPKQKWNRAAGIRAITGQVGRGSIIEYDPNNHMTIDGNIRTPRVGLSHELKHSLDYDTGHESDVYIEGIKLMEIEAINMENKVRSVTKDEKRTKYNGKDIPPSLLE